MDRQWAKAVEAGKKNQSTLALVQNWCAHARIENHGVGIIALQTGLPIGLLAMACDYATSDRSMAAWELADVALNFHDANCVGCKCRKPVRLPNLSELVAKRDAAIRVEEARATDQETQQADALRRRRAAREELRTKLPPPSRTLVDHLEALDTGSETTASEALEAAAGLAPEAFTPPLVEFLFRLIETDERWATETALVVLDKVGAASDRLANGALHSLERYGGVKSAEVLLRHLDHARADLVSGAVPMLIHHAEPADLPFIQRDRNADPRFLLAVHKAFPTEVESVVDDLLGSGNPGHLSDGARAVCVLGATDGAIALKFARSVISKLARTNWDDDFDHQLSVVRGELRRAAAVAFRFDPAATEALIEAFRLGASPNGHKELLNIYLGVLHRAWEEKSKPSDAGERAAFDRVIALAANPPNDETVQELGSFFAHSASRFKDLAAEKIDALLGAAALLADALVHFDAQDKGTTPTTLLGALERNSHRGSLAGLQGSLTELAAEAAAGDPARTRKFLSLLSGIPSDRPVLRSALIHHLDRLITSPETLAEVLPYLYSALVGAQTLERGAAAKTIGKIESKLLEDAPPLLLEAFVALLSDQYLYPIAEAIESLERVQLPGAMETEVRHRLWVIICAYAKTGDQQRLLVQAIDTFTIRFMSDGQKAGPAGETVIAILDGHEVGYYYRELRHLAYHFRRQPAFGRLVLKALQAPNYRDLDDTVRLLGDLPASTVAANAVALEALVGQLSLDREEWRIGQVLIEAFTRSSLYAEALRAIDAILARIDDVPRNRRHRLHLAAVRAAVEIERAGADGTLDDIGSLANLWREASKRDQDESGRSGRVDFHDAFEARLAGLESLLEARTSSFIDAERLRRHADALDGLTSFYDQTAAGPAYGAFAELLKIAALLVQWRAAILAGGADADRFLRAARERARIWVSEQAAAEVATRVFAAADGLANLTRIANLSALLSTFACTPLPIGIYPSERARIRLTALAQEEEKAPPPELAVTFLVFAIDGQPAAEIHFLTPGESHDLDLEVRVSHWPKGAEKLELRPLTIEAVGTYDFPIFSFARPGGEPPFVLRDRRRAIIKSPQGLNARPFEFRYAASFVPTTVQQPVATLGQRTLRIESIDLKANSLTGYPGLDIKIIEIREVLRSHYNIPPDDLGAALKLATALAAYMGRVLQDNEIAEVLPEERFQKLVRAELRRRPEIGAALSEHPQAAGGIADFSLLGVPLELKTEGQKRLTLAACNQYVAQTTSYAHGNSKRVGVLCVLDSSPKTQAAAPAEACIGILRDEVSGVNSPVITILVQANLAKPSSLSR